MKTKAVIFDFDDTLVKTREIKWAQHKAVAKRFYGIDLSDETLREHWGKPYDETLRHYYQGADTIENMRASKLSLEADFPIAAYEGAVKLVTDLLDAGVVVGVVSSSAKELVLADLRRLHFPVESFCLVQTSEHTSVHKPHPGVFKPMLACLRQRSITDRIVYIGDGLGNWLAASAAGLDFIGITSGLTDKETFIKAGADKVVLRISDVMSQLD